jgi:hypothetical protein
MHDLMREGCCIKGQLSTLPMGYCTVKTVIPKYKTWYYRLPGKNEMIKSDAKGILLGGKYE